MKRNIVIAAVTAAALIGGGTATADSRVAVIQSRLTGRETPPARFCWHCRKPLHARTDRCPFCGESQ